MATEDMVMEMNEQKKDFFEQTEVLPCGIHVRKYLRHNDMNALARAMANMRLLNDEQAQTMVFTELTPYAETLLFLTYCTDCDGSQFLRPATEEGESPEVDPDALMDWAVENGVCPEYFRTWCFSWEMAVTISRNLAGVVYEQHRQEMDFGHKLAVAFGDILDGSSEEIVRQANGLGETLIDLIGKAKEAAQPQASVVSFAKKKK